MTGREKEIKKMLSSFLHKAKKERRTDLYKRKTPYGTLKYSTAGIVGMGRGGAFMYDSAYATLSLPEGGYYLYYSGKPMELVTFKNGWPISKVIK